MSTRGRFSSEVDQIESIAETKGIDLDDVDVREGTTDDGDELITFRIYETKAESEEDSIGVQVSKLPSIQTGDMTFRNDVQNKMNSLKRYLAGEQPSDQVDEEPDESDTESDEADTTEREPVQTDSEQRSTQSGTVGAEIDRRFSEIESQLDALESRVEDLEQKGEALDGLQKLMNDE